MVELGKVVVVVVMVGDGGGYGGGGGAGGGGWRGHGSDPCILRRSHSSFSCTFSYSATVSSFPIDVKNKLYLAVELPGQVTLIQSHLSGEMMAEEDLAGEGFSKGPDRFK